MLLMGHRCSLAAPPLNRPVNGPNVKPVPTMLCAQVWFNPRGGGSLCRNSYHPHVSGLGR